MRAAASLSLAVALAAGTAGVASAAPITAIEVRENHKTTDHTVIQISRLTLGDDWTAERGAQAVRDLVSSGLFSRVEVDDEPDAAADGVRVVIVAHDKHSWVVVPTYYDQPTNRGGGLGFGENNLFGENKKLLLYGQVATGDSMFLGVYIDPSIRFSKFRWELDVFLKSARSFEYAPPTDFRALPPKVRTSQLRYLDARVGAGMRITHDLSADLRVRGAQVSYRRVALAPDATLADVTDDPAATDPPAPGDEGWDVSTVTELTWDSRSNWYGLTRGNKVHVEYEQALPGLSTFDYGLLTVTAEHAHVLLGRHGLDVRAKLGLGYDLPFQAEYASGGNALRGYANDQFRGDTKATANVEYSVPLFDVRGFALRGLGFVDLAYTTFLHTAHADRAYLPGAEARGLAPLRTSVGGGIRVYLRQIVLPLLGLDVGYAPETGSHELYLAIGLTDL